MPLCILVGLLSFSLQRLKIPLLPASTAGPGFVCLYVICKLNQIRVNYKRLIYDIHKCELNFSILANIWPLKKTKVQYNTRIFP